MGKFNEYSIPFTPPSIDLFHHFFTPYLVTPITLYSTNHTLSQDFCLIIVHHTEHYLIVASYEPLNTCTTLLNYIFYSVSITTGKVIDRCELPNDYLQLAHNKCSSVYNHQLSILSIHHQIIHRFIISEDGQFHQLLPIGCIHHDNSLFYDQHRDTIQPSDTFSDNSFKQSDIHREAYQYHRNRRKPFSPLCSQLSIIGAHLLSDNRILVKLVPSSETFTLERIQSYHVFVVFDINSSTIESIHDNSTEESIHQLCSCLSTEIPMQQWIREPRLSQLSSMLPWILQRKTVSPYFDGRLFSCSEQLIPINDSGHIILKSDDPCLFQFNDTTSDHLAFQLDANSRSTHDTVPSCHKCLSILSHPSLPFIITIQSRVLETPIINFHVYSVTNTDH
ncbi:De-etiolated protein 1 Det1-domain-containing protein [Pilobolus umbonatus]|nr:De-etiolated protein 1 Det1-domain-containing protein [Pilobolus umbonatus]